MKAEDHRPGASAAATLAGAVKLGMLLLFAAGLGG